MCYVVYGWSHTVLFNCSWIKRNRKPHKNGTSLYGFNVLKKIQQHFISKEKAFPASKKISISSAQSPCITALPSRAAMLWHNTTDDGDVCSVIRLKQFRMISDAHKICTRRKLCSTSVESRAESEWLQNGGLGYSYHATVSPHGSFFFNMQFLALHSWCRQPFTPMRISFMVGCTVRDILGYGGAFLYTTSDFPFFSIYYSSRWLADMAV